MMKKTLKGSLAAAAGLALGLGAAGTSPAQDGEDPVAPTAAGNVISTGGIQLNGSIGGQNKDINAELLGIELAEDDVRVVYCIQINVGLLQQFTHEERAWDEIDVEDLPMVLGVLLNGFDGSNAAELIETAGVAGADFEGFTDEQIAYAGTQAAIWSLTDDWDIDADPTEGGQGVDNAVAGIQTHLLDNSEPADEPEAPTAGIDNSEAVADGDTFGPFTVSTNLGSVAFEQPEGATIVDENGEALTEISDGQSIYVKFDDGVEPAPLTVTTDEVDWTTPVGRVFVPVDGEGATQAGQNLILGEDHVQPVAIELAFQFSEEVTESPSAQPQLPATGSNLTAFAGIGGAVLVAGVIAIVLMRRRAATAGADWGDEN